MKKKKTPRSNIKYPALNPGYAPKVRQEFIDIDYVDKLSDVPSIEMPDGTMISEKAWLNKFMGEFVGADLNYKDLSKNLHNTPELKKDCTDKNNARNRCMYGIAKANGLVSDDIRQQSEEIQVTNFQEYEDRLIEYLDDRSDLEKSIDNPESNGN